jgi:hypothetical protein
MAKAGKRRRWRLGAGVLLVIVLLPSALAELRPAATPRPTGSAETPQAFAPPELVALALGIEVAPRFELLAPEPPLRPEEPPPTAESLTQGLLQVARVPEPAAAWLFGLSAASAAFASRGRRRCLRPRPGR